MASVRLCEKKKKIKFSIILGFHALLYSHAYPRPIRVTGEIESVKEKRKSIICISQDKFGSAIIKENALLMSFVDDVCQVEMHCERVSQNPTVFHTLFS